MDDIALQSLKAYLSINDTFSGIVTDVSLVQSLNALPSILDTLRPIVNDVKLVILSHSDLGMIKTSSPIVKDVTLVFPLVDAQSLKGELVYVQLGAFQITDLKLVQLAKYPELIFVTVGRISISTKLD